MASRNFAERGHSSTPFPLSKTRAISVREYQSKSPPDLAERHKLERASHQPVNARENLLPRLQHL